MAEVTPTIDVMYSCPKCPVANAVVTVPARLEVDILPWTEKTVELCRLDHMRRSPHCRAKTLDLMVPMDNRDRIGGPRIQ